MNSNECKYGFFDLNNQEYVITTPYTPKAWINYLGGTGDIDAFISNRAGGTAWYKQPQSGRLTRYQYTALPEDRSGFYLYIRTKDGTVWNPSCTPTCTKLDKYKCCHGTYYTRFDSQKNGLQAQIKYFIPRQDAVLLWDVVLTNNSEQEQEFSIYPYMDFSMRDVLKDVLYYHFTGNQMGGFYDEKHNALVLDYCAFEAQYPGYTLLNASKPFTAYEMSRDVFIGRCRSESNPAAMENGDLSNSEIPGGGFPICGVFKLDFKLAPGASERVIIKLAVDSKLENAAKLLEKYNDFAAVDSAAADFENWWQKVLGKNQIATPDEALNAMLNTWFPKNIKTTMRCGRAISHRHTGTRPSTSFRDTMQDIMSGVTFFPEETREKILILMHSVRANGQLVKHIDTQNFTCSMPENNRCD
ncbi:MAG: hypothetical protein J6Q81_00175, partial [Lentisphaeria bacterium]|nr:hypothetical protein [Lentisphaeria bacterium]